MKFFYLIALPLALVSCAGYEVGDSKPASLARVKTIAVPMFKNSTLLPRGEAMATSAVVAALVQDGTYQIADIGKADAILDGTLRSVRYSNVRGSRINVLRPEELENNVTIDWTLRDAKNPTRTLASGASAGSSTFFAASNLQTARNNAMPDALGRAGVALASAIANGF
jgi:Lipopolysaccharide-assembly